MTNNNKRQFIRPIPSKQMELRVRHLTRRDDTSMFDMHGKYITAYKPDKSERSFRNVYHYLRFDWEAHLNEPYCCDVCTPRHDDLFLNLSEVLLGDLQNAFGLPLNRRSAVFETECSKLKNYDDTEFNVYDEIDPLELTNNIENSLSELVHYLKNLSSNYKTMLKLLTESVSKDELLTVYSWEFDCEVKKDLILFSPLWLRSPLDWKGGSLSDAFQHLFSVYETPPLVDQSRERNDPFKTYRPFDFLPEYKHIFLYILYAQGGSLKRFGAITHWDIPAKFAHFFAQAPFKKNLTEQIIYAEVLRLKGSEVDFTRIVNNPAYVVDITNKDVPLGNNNRLNMEGFKGFWYSTVKWVIKFSDVMTDEDSALILAWAIHRYAEAERNPNNKFSWKGRDLRPTLERAQIYNEQMHQQSTHAFQNWSAVGWDWEIKKGIDLWSVEELTTTVALFEEGSAMNHCVGGHAKGCVSGQKAIFSLKKNGSRSVTIDIAISTKKIIEAKQRFNKMPTYEQESIIQAWLSRVIAKNK